MNSSPRPFRKVCDTQAGGMSAGAVRSSNSCSQVRLKGPWGDEKDTEIIRFEKGQTKTTGGKRRMERYCR